MKPKLIFTDESLPLILEALNININDLDITKIVGFKKDLGIIMRDVA